MEKKREVLTTARLSLHGYDEGDLERMARILFDEQINKTFMIPELSDIDQAKVLAEKVMALSKAEGEFEYGIYLNGELIGFVNNCGKEETTIELGYVILPEYWGKAYASEALKACIDELFRMGYRQVTAGYFEENGASKRVMEKCGMHPIDVEEDVEYRGTTHHCLYCGIEKRN